MHTPQKDDVHCHSQCSDGAFSPEELVERARERGLSGLAVTDHDTTEGARRALEYGKKVGFSVVSGVEISVGFPVKNDRGGVVYKPLHMLWYGFDPENQALNDMLTQTVKIREERIRSMVQSLNAELIQEGRNPLDIEVLLRKGMERPLSRPDIANYLLELGYVSNFQEAFEKWLRRLNVELVPISVKESIDLIHQAGGIAVLAHPDMQSVSLREVSNRDFGQMRAIVQMVKMGLDGIETFRLNQDPKDARKWQHIAKRYNLITTAGSDFHSIEISGVNKDLGGHLATEESIPKILKLREKRRQHG